MTGLGIKRPGAQRSVVASAPPPSAFAARCRAAGAGQLAGLIAGLYQARGWATERHGTRRVTAVRGDRQREIVVADPDCGPIPPTADAVLAVDPSTGVPAGVDRIDATELHRQLCYAVERDTARQLLETHLDCSAATARTVLQSSGPGPTSGSAGEDATSRPRGASTATRGGSDSGSDGPRTAVLAVAVGSLVALLLVAGIAVLVTGGQPNASPETAEASTPPAAPTSTATAAPSVGATPPPAGGVDGRPTAGSPAVAYPPGVSAAGVVDPARLATAHRRQLANTSYELLLTHQEYVDGQLTAVYTERIQVGSDERYAVDVSTIGRLRASPRRIGRLDQFGNETGVYLRESQEYPRFHSIRAEQVGGLSAQYLRLSLSAAGSSIRGQVSAENGSVFHVRTGGDGSTSGDAYVRSDGLVRYGRWTYVASGEPSVTVLFSVRIDGVGATAVRKPAWVGG